MTDSFLCFSNHDDNCQCVVHGHILRGLGTPSGASYCKSVVPVFRTSRNFSGNVTNSLCIFNKNTVQAGILPFLMSETD